MLKPGDDILIGKAEERYWLEKIRNAKMEPLVPSWGIQAASSTTAETSIDDEASLKALSRISKGDPAAVYAVLLAVLNILIFKYLEQDDLVIVAPLPDTDLNLRENVSFFRISVNREMQVKSLIQETGKQLVANKNKCTTDISFLHEKLRLSGDEAYLSLQHVGFFFGDAGDVPDWYGRVAICFNLENKGGRIALSIRHTLTPYSGAWVNGLLRHYKAILKQAVADPGLTVGSINIFSSQEAQAIVTGLNDTGFAYADDGVSRLFERQVLTASRSEALVFEQIRFTYEALNGRVNRLAHYLLSHTGANDRKPVAVMLERSEWSAIAMLAIIKTGTCYLPLDLALPANRLAYILENAKPALILTESTLHDKIPANTMSIPCVNIREIDLEGFPAGNPGLQLNMNDPAFLIYTSGSTGMPKGVVQTQRTLLNLILWDMACPGFEPGSSILQYSSFAFDSSLHDIYYALCSGGAAHIVPEETRTDYNAMAEYIVKEKINIVSLPFSVLAGFFDFTGTNSLHGHQIAHIISTGEQLLVGYNLEQFLLKNQAVRLHNFYGPSETHVVTAYSCTGAEPVPKRAPIGKPVFNSRIYILNQHLELAPVGATGEIYIGGDNLAIGYLADPVLTGNKFLPDRFVQGERMYKSGDLGRWLPDGNIEYLGRMDNQIKIRGYRIELGEIEKRIHSHNAVEDAVVIETGEGENKELVAYIKYKTPGHDADLGSYMLEHLPAYMAPSHFIPVTAFPLTPNGKLDKKRLPGIVSARKKYEPPVTGEQVLLQQIWEEVLGKTEIGIDDNFFEIGGHSLKATRVISAVYKRLDRKITLKNIFLQPTIRELSSLIGSKEEIRFKNIPTLPVQPDYELSHSQRRIWVLEQFEENSLAYVMPMVFAITGELDAKAIDFAFLQIIARHESLRTIFIIKGGTPRQVIKAPGEVPFAIPVTDLCGKTGAQAVVETEIGKNASTSFDLEKGPLLRGIIFRIHENRHIFSFAMHHIISDGWSMNIFIKELLFYYRQHTGGPAAVLAPLKIHYKDYSAWQINELLSGSAETSRQYWLSRFSGEIPVLHHPTDYSRISDMAKTSRTTIIDIDKTLAWQVQSYCLKREVSNFIFWLAVVKTLLFRYTEQEDIIIGTPVSGRIHPDLEDQIGVYINTLPIRSSPAAGKSFSVFLSELRNDVTDAYQHQDYPFDKLVDELKLERDNTRNPLFDIMVQLDILDQPKESGLDLEIETISAGTGVSSFDLVFNFELSGDALRVIIGSNAALYNPETIIRMAEHLQRIAAAVIPADGIELGDINYLSGGDRALLASYNQTEKLTIPHTIDQLATMQAIINPDGIAIREPRRSVSFQQLRVDSNRIASYLLEKACMPEAVIAVVASRGGTMIKALLGVLKAGCAYLPVDPDIPEERIKYMLQDAGVQWILLDNAEYISKFSLDSARCLVLDAACSGLQAYASTDPETLKNAHQLACVYYTSGSTGKPKGVLLIHAGIVNRLAWFWENFNCNSHDVYLFKTSFMFDVSMSEMFMPVCFGCSMLILDTDTIEHAGLLSRAIETYGVTIVHFSPTLLNLFLETLDQEGFGKLASVRYLLCSGEALPKSVVQKYYRLINTPVVNLYGPTEASIEVSWHVCSMQDEVIAIGKPISNTGLHILDRRNRQVPAGIEGEICISGIALARGYLNNEATTNERFVEAVIDGKQVLVYKTGDRGKWNDSGEVEFFGRKDNQLSIGGYRIEPGEIEQNLGEHASVSDACVVATRADDNTKSLTAYIIKKEMANELTGKRFDDGEQPEEPRLATEEELHVLKEFNARYTAYEADVLFHELFENQAALVAGRYSPFCLKIAG